jgi:formate-dependent nitrite reductase membrane component NrfD
VGHFAKYTERLAWQGEDLVKELLEKSGNALHVPAGENFFPQRNIEVLTGKNVKRVYNAPAKGLLWGWEVPAYVTMKAVAAGAFLVPMLSLVIRNSRGYIGLGNLFAGIITGLIFLVATTALLVKDLDQPKRFHYVLLRPQWKSWLVRGGYALTLYGGLLTLTGLALWFVGSSVWGAVLPWLAVATAIAAIVTAVYTAFLFAQARGRDFWQSPLLPLHMLVHAFVAGGAIFTLLDAVGLTKAGNFAAWVLLLSLCANLLVLLAELTVAHPTSDAKATAAMILKGPYRSRFWWAVITGNIIPR